MTSKQIPMNVIVSVLRNRLVCPFPEYRAFLDFYTGAKVPLWDIELVRERVAKHLLKTFPELSRVPDPPEKTDSGNAGKYVRACAKAVGYDEVSVQVGKVRYTERTLSKALK